MNSLLYALDSRKSEILNAIFVNNHFLHNRRCSEKLHPWNHLIFQSEAIFIFFSTLCDSNQNDHILITKKFFLTFFSQLSLAQIIHFHKFVFFAELLRLYLMKFDLEPANLVPYDMNVKTSELENAVGKEIKHRYFGRIPIALSNSKVGEVSHKC